VSLLRGYIRDLRIDPHDAGEVLLEIDGEIDAETLGDYLDGAGYPELCADVYKREGLR
jgi:hypothetical protein